MANLLIDPGFEEGSPAWTWEDRGHATSTLPHAGLLSAELTCANQVPGPGGPVTYGSGTHQQVDTVSGSTYVLAGWITQQMALPVNSTLEVWVDRTTGDGSHYERIGTFDGTAIGELEWSLVVLGSFVAAGPKAMVRIWTPVPPVAGSIAYWFVDDLDLPSAEEFMKRSRWLAHQQLATILQGINGTPTYHLNVGGRVYYRLLQPSAEAVPTFPYVCLPLAFDDPVYENETRHIVMRWTMTLYGFVPDAQGENFDCTAHRDAVYLHEDMLLALRNNPTLNGTVDSIELLDGGGGLAGVDDTPWGEIQVPIRLAMHLGPDVLGP